MTSSHYTGSPQVKVVSSLTPEVTGVGGVKGATFNNGNGEHGMDKHDNYFLHRICYICLIFVVVFILSGYLHV